MIIIGDKQLTFEDVVKVARYNEKVSLSDCAINRIKSSRSVVDKYVNEAKIAYGVTTGVGKLCNTIIEPEQTLQLQINLSKSHSTGICKPLSEEEVRAIMIIRINNFTLGHSGISLPVVEIMVDMLNANIHPVLPKRGGVGSSGSLSIGGHMALCITGNSEVFLNGNRMSTEEALKLNGIKPVVLQAKDCLSVINGTHAMCGIGALALWDMWIAVKTSEISAAMGLEALNGNTSAFDSRLNSAKLHKGQRDAASNILKMIEKSELYNLKHKSVQDAYCYRCIPQVDGGARELLSFAETILNNEINSVSDNPLVFSDEEEIISGGNFHGQIAGHALDSLSMAAATIAKISERRISRMVDPQSSGLPAFLVENSGLNSGFMIPQYIAASLVSEIKLLAIPAAIDSIPTSGGQEDVVSNGTISANKAKEATELLNYIIGIELACSAQALDLSGRSNLGVGTAKAFEFIRKHLKKLDCDRFLEPDLQIITSLVSSGQLIEEVEKTIGTLD